MLARYWIVAFCLPALIACHSEKRKLSEELRTLEDRHLALVHKLDAQTDAVRDAERRIEKMRGELATCNANIRTFLAGHPVAAACIRASHQSWGGGEESAWANELKAYARVTTVLCSAALLSEEFAREVETVTTRLREGNDRVKELTAKIAELQSTVDTQRKELQRADAEVDRLSAEIASVRGRLSGDARP